MQFNSDMPPCHSESFWIKIVQRKQIKSPIIYFIYVKTLTEFLLLVGAFTEHFLEEVALLRHLYINPNEKSNKSSLLS